MPNPLTRFPMPRRRLSCDLPDPLEWPRQARPLVVAPSRADRRAVEASMAHGRRFFRQRQQGRGARRSAFSFAHGALPPCRVRRMSAAEAHHDF